MVRAWATPRTRRHEALDEPQVLSGDVKLTRWSGNGGQGQRVPAGPEGGGPAFWLGKDLAARGCDPYPVEVSRHVHGGSAVVLSLPGDRQEPQFPANMSAEQAADWLRANGQEATPESVAASLPSISSTSRTLTFCAISLSVSVRYPVFDIAVYVIAIIEWNHVAKYFSG